MVREARAATFAKAEMAGPALAIPPKSPSDVFGKGGLDNAAPSPMTLFSSFFGDDEAFTDFKPLSSALAGTLVSPAGSGELNLFNTACSIEVQACSMKSTKEGIVNVQEQKLHTGNAKYKSMVPSRLPIPATSSYLTIPPGLSPTTLLDSPVFLNSEQVDPSPTTGTLYSILQKEVSHLSATGEQVKQKDITIQQQGCFGSLHRPEDVAMKLKLVSSGLSVDAALPGSIPTFESTPGQALEFLHDGSNLQKTSESDALITKTLEVVSNIQVSEVASQCIHERTAVDGYNWKKYGQKQLKGTEFPRSYYKCTHSNCPVKKQVECSHEGEITEIMYKGEHNHAKPQAIRRGSRSGGQSFVHENNVEAPNTFCRTESDRFSTDLSSSSLVGGLAGTPEQSFGSPSTEEGDDVEHGKVEEDGEDEQDSKRRRIENLRETLSSAPVRTIREPRVVVQTTSEVDILDDGYRWRKYGQKVVKGNRFPRSYYKCTNVGCTVRKHVERSSTDPTSVMTAYEGKHNHNVPVARGSARETTGASAGPPLFGTYGPIGLSSVQIGVRPAMMYEPQELGSLVDKCFNGGNRFDASRPSPFGSHADRNGGELVPSKTVDRTMGLDLSVMRRFGVGESSEQHLGLNFLQPMCQLSPPACVVEGPLSRS